MKSRRSGVQPGGSYGNSRNGPPPTPQQTCRLASKPIPLVHVWGVNQRLRRSTTSASVRAPATPSDSTTSGWKTSSASTASAFQSSIERARHLAAGDPRADPRAQPAHPLEVGAGERLLDPQHAELVELRDHARRIGRPQPRLDVAGHPPPLVEVDHDLERLPDLVADRGRRGDPLGERVAGNAQLDRAKTGVDERASVLGTLRRRAQLTERGVDRQPVDGPSEQRIHGDAEFLAEQIPQRGLHRPVAAGVKRDRLERPRVTRQQQRIAADEQVLEILEAGHRVAGADARQALVGFDADDRRVELAPRIGVPRGIEGWVEWQPQPLHPDRRDPHEPL